MAIAAQVLLENGVIYTGYASTPLTHALAIRDQRVIAFGEAARELANATTKRLDLRGGIALPGFVDAHIHLLWYGLQLAQTDLTDITSFALVEARIRERASAAPDGAWITGGGWNQDLWQGVVPSKELLDRIAPRQPVVLRRKDGHSIWVNSAALKAANVNAGTPDPPGGRIEHDGHGEPSGILAEEAMRLVTGCLPATSSDDEDRALKEAMRQAHAAGITGVHVMERADGRAAFQRAYEGNRLTLRTQMMIDVGSWRAGWPSDRSTNTGTDMLRIGSLKLFADGALGSRTAAMLEPFIGQTPNLGVIVTPYEELVPLIRQAAEQHVATAIHAIGDRANRIVLDAFEHTQEVWKPKGLRQRIEHVQLLHEDDLPRLAELGVVASMQPIHATADMHIADTYWGERSRLGYAWRSVLDSGAALCFGSDCPVETLSVLRGIAAAVTRQDERRQPPEGWYPQQRVSVAEAMAAYTIGAAYAAGREHELGSLAPRKFADITVLNADPYRVAAHELADLSVTATIVGGDVVYEQL